MFITKTTTASPPFPPAWQKQIAAFFYCFSLPSWDNRSARYKDKPPARALPPLFSPGRPKFDVSFKSFSFGVSTEGGPCRGGNCSPGRINPGVEKPLAAVRVSHQ